MNNNNPAQTLGFICQVVDKDFYPLGDVFSVRVWPGQFIDEAVNKIKSSKCEMIRDLGIIDDLVSIGDVGATLWKLSNPYPMPGELADKRVAANNLLERVRQQLSLLEKLDILLHISRYFDAESLPDGHLHLLLQLAISGADRANPFLPLRRPPAH